MPAILLCLSETWRGPGPSPTPFPQCHGEEQMASLGVLLLSSPSFHFWLFLSLRHCISEYREERACPSVLMPACVYVDTRVVPLSSSCLRQAHPTPSLCSSFPLVFIVSSKKNKVEMCRVRKTCSIFFFFLKEEKKGQETGPEGSSSLYPRPDHLAPYLKPIPIGTGT